MKDAKGNELNVGDYVITWHKMGSSIYTRDGIIVDIVKSGFTPGVVIEYDNVFGNKDRITKMSDKVIKAIKF